MNTNIEINQTSETINSVHLSDNEKIQALESKIAKLSEICQGLDPYAPISVEFKAKLREFNLHNADDPFKITNSLLMLLEDAIDELHVLKPFTDDPFKF